MLEHRAQPEIRDLEIPVRSEQQVLGLDITVRHAFRVYKILVTTCSSDYKVDIVNAPTIPATS